MYRIIKVLNNNAILALDQEKKREIILLGNGIGFGKHPGEEIKMIQSAKIYTLVTKKKQTSALKVVNGIKPVYLEATGRILEEAERVFEKVSHDSLLPLADHIALAAKRAEEKMQIPNPFTPDIKVLFEKEYKVALKGREIIREMTGAEISDDEVGFISLHIHSARSDEKVSETLDNTRLINEGIRMIEEYFQIDLEQDSLGYNRMMSHIYYMLVRTRKGEQVKADLNDFVQVKYPKEFAAAEKICAWIEKGSQDRRDRISCNPHFADCKSGIARANRKILKDSPRREHQTGRLIRSPAGRFYVFLYDFRRPFGTVPDFRYNVPVKLRFVADQKKTSPVFQERFFQGIFCVRIQMVGRLIQKQKIGITVYEFAQTDFSLLPSA